MFSEIMQADILFHAPYLNKNNKLLTKSTRASGTPHRLSTLSHLKKNTKIMSAAQFETWHAPNL